MTSIHTRSFGGIHEAEWRRGGIIAVTATLGALATALGARRRGMLGMALATIGGLALRRAFDDGLALARELDARARAHRRDAGTAAPLDDVRDAVDEASWESFPASDPPSYGR